MLENIGREPKGRLGVPFPGMTHSFSRTPRRLPIQHPISLYPYRTRSFRGFDGNQDQQGKTSQSSRTRTLSLVLDASPSFMKVGNEYLDTFLLWLWQDFFIRSVIYSRVKVA
jgi:hypothetical protein